MKFRKALETMGDVLDDGIVFVRYVGEPAKESRMMPVWMANRLFRPSLSVDAVRFLEDGMHEYVLR